MFVYLICIVELFRDACDSKAGSNADNVTAMSASRPAFTPASPIAMALGARMMPVWKGVQRKTGWRISAVKKLALLNADSYRNAAMEAMTKRALRYRLTSQPS